MNTRLLIAYHLIWTNYGRWLPNDPRGSGSAVVIDPEIAALGEIHLGRKQVQPSPQELRAFMAKATPLLRYEPFDLGSREIAAVADAFAEVIAKQNYTCYACAIMPDHVHLLIRRHRQLGDEMAERLQDMSRDAVLGLKMCDPDHPVWVDGWWKRYVFDPTDLRRVIQYIENNPVRMGWAKQIWPFIKPYDGWPLHPGHNPNSPWARGLRGEDPLSGVKRQTRKREE